MPDAGLDHPQPPDTRRVATSATSGLRLDARRIVLRFVRHRAVRWAAIGLLLGTGLTVFADWFIAFPEGVQATYVTRGKCIECHKAEHHAWQGSHHDKAMDQATPEFVLGNFDNQEFAYDGRVSRFTREDDKFFVTTDGPGGKPGTFRVSYTFGVEPLQQYMVEMEHGACRCSPSPGTPRANGGSISIRTILGPSGTTIRCIGPSRARTGTMSAPTAIRPTSRRATTTPPTPSTPPTARST